MKRILFLLMALVLFLFMVLAAVLQGTLAHA